MNRPHPSLDVAQIPLAARSSLHARLHTLSDASVLQTLCAQVAIVVANSKPPGQPQLVIRVHDGSARRRNAPRVGRVQEVHPQGQAGWGDPVPGVVRSTQGAAGGALALGRRGQSSSLLVGSVLLQPQPAVRGVSSGHRSMCACLHRLCASSRTHRAQRPRAAAFGAGSELEANEQAGRSRKL